MKKHPLFLTAFLTATTPLSLFAGTVYWDANGDDPGAGPAPAGNWGSDAFWNTDVDGSLTPAVWIPGDTAVFSAGTDGIGAWNLNLTGTQTAASVVVEEGTITVGSSGVIDTGASTFTIGTGAGSAARVNIPSTLRLNSAGKVVLDGGTLFHTNPATAGSFINIAKGLEISANGGAVGYDDGSSTTALTTIYSGTITGTGGTTGNGGVGTLTKVGPDEFRYQGLGLPNTTYSRLRVLQGLFRLGFNSSISDERGFGAVPTAFTPDAITLDGGGSIGTSFTAANSVLHVNRGITLGDGGGAISGSMTIPGAITGTGTFSHLTTGTVVLTGNSDYSGDTLVNLGIVVAGSANALGAPSGDTKVLAGAEVRIDGASSTFTINEPFQIAGGGGGGGGAITVQNASAPTIAGPVTLTADATVTVSGTATVVYTNANSFTSLANQNLKLQGGTISTGGGGTVSGIIALGSGGLTKLQGGKWTLDGANTYSGPTVVGAGTLNIGGSIASSSGIDVQTGATLQVSGAAANRLGDTAVVGMTGTAKILLSGNITETAGALTLNAGTGTFDFGAGTCSFTFANSSAATWAGTLAITNWSGTPGTGGGADQLRFGPAGLIPAQVAALSFVDPAGLPAGSYAAILLPSGEVVPPAAATPPCVAWQQTEFGANAGNPLIAGFDADPDFDGNLNLTEYALLGSPNSSTPTELFTRGVSGGKMTLAFQRDITRNDITIRVQSSSTLSGAWADEAVSVNGAAFIPTAPANVVETGAGNVKSVTFTDAAAVGASPIRFLRIRISK